MLRIVSCHRSITRRKKMQSGNIRIRITQFWISQASRNARSFSMTLKQTFPERGVNQMYGFENKQILLHCLHAR